MKALERRAARRRVYSLTALGGIIVVGIVGILMAFGKARQRTEQMYRDPLLALRNLAPKETLFKLHHGRYASLEELVKEGVISDEVLEGPVQGYLYRAPVADKERFIITADPSGEPAPLPPGARPSPRRFYSVDETHTIRVSDTAPVTSMSPVIWSPRDAGPR